MKEKKQIERLFQESFKDFEARPNDTVWENIQAKLDQPEKSKKKFVPIWWKYAGVAALLVLLLGLLGKSFLSDSIDLPENTITNSQELDSNSVASPEGNNPLTDESQDEIQNSPNGLKDEGQTLLPSNDNGTPTKVADKENPSKISRDGKSAPTGVASNNNPQDTSRFSSKETIPNQGENGLANNNPDSNDNAPSTSSNNIKQDSNSSSPEGLALNSQTKRDASEEIPSEANKSPLDKESKINMGVEGLANTASDLENEPNQPEEIASLVEEAKDSLTIEEAIAENEDITTDEKEKLVNRWQVYANIAPVYYNTLGEGSHLHEQFVGNSKTGEVNTSYGVNVGYALSDKFTVRTGINSLKLSYDTSDVILYQSVGDGFNPEAQLKNVNITSNVPYANISVLSSENLVAQQINSALDPSFNAAISQRISYLEVPVEIEYNLINRKFNVGVIGGFSTFFLGGNEVYTEFQGRKNYIGEANNINNVSFSANLGLGLDYNFSKKFKFNLEPTFKYQLNAYSDTSGDFRPYIIGVYTGFSYKF